MDEVVQQVLGGPAEDDVRARRADEPRLPDDGGLEEAADLAAVRPDRGRVEVVPGELAYERGREGAARVAERGVDEDVEEGLELVGDLQWLVRVQEAGD